MEHNSRVRSRLDLEQAQRSMSHVLQGCVAGGAAAWSCKGRDPPVGNLDQLYAYGQGVGAPAAGTSAGSEEGGMAWAAVADADVGGGGGQEGGRGTTGQPGTRQQQAPSGPGSSQHFMHPSGAGAAGL